MSERFDMLVKQMIFVEKNKKDRQHGQTLNDLSTCKIHLHCYLANHLP